MTTSIPAVVTLRTGNLYDPSFSTPYSFHLNVGIQRGLRPGLVLSVDYLYQRGVHSVLGHEANRHGAADILSVPSALAVMNGLHDALGCPPGWDGVDCAIAAGATITDYGAFGRGGCEWASPGSPNPCAFPGMNPNFNSVGIFGLQGKSPKFLVQVMSQAWLAQSIALRFGGDGKALVVPVAQDSLSNLAALAFLGRLRRAATSESGSCATEENSCGAGGPGSAGRSV